MKSIAGLSVLVILAMMQLSCATPTSSTTTSMKTTLVTTTPATTKTSGSNNLAGKIAFVSGDMLEDCELYTINADGTNLKKLTNNSIGAIRPAWSSDGKRIAFASVNDGGIYTINADGTNLIRIVPQTEYIDDYGYRIECGKSRPSWSPDGSMICYSSYQDKDTETNSQLVNSNIYVVNSDGTGKRRLTKELDLEDYSSWSPDGSKIAFIHEKAEDDGGASLNVYVMNTDGSNWVQLTKDVNIWLDDFHLSWSPDGTKIIFNGSVADAVQGAIEGLFCVNLKDKSLKFITKEAGIYPSWSPDGTKIMFSAGDNNNKTSIYVMDADGSNFTMINVPIEPRYPVWISP